MITISLCMIVKNEEEVLERCLNSLKGLMDEIIIVDTGSTDSTKEIAARYTEDRISAARLRHLRAVCRLLSEPRGVLWTISGERQSGLTM